MRALFLALALLLALPVVAKPQAVSADEYCMAVNIYYEARTDGEDSMRGVGYVTANRARNRRQSICHVVFAYKQFSWVEQYRVLTPAGHLKDEFRPLAHDTRWIASQRIAHEVLAHPENDLTQGAEFFVANYIFPRCLKNSCRWIKNLDYVDRYGSHLFFRTRLRQKTIVYVSPYTIVVVDPVSWALSYPSFLQRRGVPCYACPYDYLLARDFEGVRNG
jgi:hypothetical protein